MKFDFRTIAIGDPDYQAGYWPYVLMQLKKDYGFELFTDDFYDFLRTEIGINVLFEMENAPTTISGIELSDEHWTMILLKYPMRKYSLRYSSD